MGTMIGAIDIYDWRRHFQLFTFGHLEEEKIPAKDFSQASVGWVCLLNQCLQPRARVTRLGEFSPNAQLFTLCNLKKIQL
jgi:hypothetical protein